jgi:hypothetical protein
VIGAVLLIPSLAVLWTMRCPGCGAWIAKQANVFAFLHVSCAHWRRLRQRDGGNS